MRKQTIVVLVLAALGLLGSNIGRAATITLQQGVNGYSGCKDSFVTVTPNYYSEDVAGVNYGINRFLILNSEHFKSN